MALKVPPKKTTVSNHCHVHIIGNSILVIGILDIASLITGYASVKSHSMVIYLVHNTKKQFVQCFGSVYIVHVDSRRCLRKLQMKEFFLPNADCEQQLRYIVMSIYLENKDII